MNTVSGKEGREAGSTAEVGGTQRGLCSRRKGMVHREGDLCSRGAITETDQLYGSLQQLKGGER